MRNCLKILFLTALLFLVAGCSEPETLEAPDSVNLSNTVPIILVHGSGGNEHTLDEISENLQDKYHFSNEKLEVLISSKGELSYRGKLTKNAKHPIITVAFEDNEAPISDWAKWLRIATDDLEKHFKFKKMDGVGYSNGGLALSAYVQGNQATPRFQKIITLGAPFNDLSEEDNAGGANFKKVAHQTAMLKSFLSKKKQNPSDLEFLSIAGISDAEHNTDSVVPLQSALSSRLIFDNVHVYMEKVERGEEASHHAIYKSAESIQLIHWFLAEYISPEKKVYQLAN
ncbi:alpha/beta hydrolase [Listeria aquatica]|uniref:alpha/beta hydrolase n=1 Tax=Listeria aquatica TaxID=1494960 RepID=UPI003F727916